MEAFVPGEAFPPTAFLRAQKNCGAHKSLALDPHRSGREEGTAAPAAGQMCLGSRPSEGTWGRRGGVRGEAAGKQKLRQLALPSVPPPEGPALVMALTQNTRHQKLRRRRVTCFTLGWTHLLLQELMEIPLFFLFFFF